jgi:protein SCO1/2
VRPLRPKHIGPRRGIAGLAITLLLLAGCGSATGDPPATAAPYHWTGAVLVHPLAKPSFVLTDQHGNPFDFQAATAGKLTLLYFGYTHCPDICPENMAALAYSVKQLPSDVQSRIAVVFVSTDPARDTPPVLTAWLANFDSSFIGLTGSVAQVDLAQFQSKVTLASAAPAQTNGTYGVDHAAQVIAYSPDDLAHVLFFQGMPTSAITRDLNQLATHPWAAG